MSGDPPPARPADHDTGPGRGSAGLDPLDAAHPVDADEAAQAEDAAVADAAARADDAARAALERARAAAHGKGLTPYGRGRRGGARPSVADAAGGGSRGDAPFGAGRDPVPVGSTLNRLLADRGWRAPLSVASVVGRWREVVGEPLADHCAPETFEDGALVVRADSTAWAVQVRLLLPQLQRRLEQEIGAGVVDSITVLGPAGPSWRRGSRSVPGRGPRDTYG